MPSLIVRPVPFNLLIFSSEHWLSILHPGNHNSFEFNHRIIQMLLSSDAFAFVLLTVEYRYSYQILRTPPDLLVNYYLPFPCVLNR